MPRYPGLKARQGNTTFLSMKHEMLFVKLLIVNPILAHAINNVINTYKISVTRFLASPCLASGYPSERYANTV